LERMPTMTSDRDMTGKTTHWEGRSQLANAVMMTIRCSQRQSSVLPSVCQSGGSLIRCGEIVPVRLRVTKNGRRGVAASEHFANHPNVDASQCRYSVVSLLPLPCVQDVPWLSSPTLVPFTVAQMHEMIAHTFEATRLGGDI